MAFTDQTLKCADCGNDFVWTASEQDFYQQKGFDNAPKRCPDCRRKKKDERNSTRTMSTIICATCGKEEQVPFVPRGDRPVYCRECFAKQKGN